MSSLEIGIVVEVKGFISKIVTFDDSNHAFFIHKGDLIKNISVNSFVIISQRFIKIVAKVNSETIWDNLNHLHEYNLDNRFSKKSVKRVIEVQTIGYIMQNKFISGATYLPMIGNVCSIPTNEEINQIFIDNYSDESNNYTINIGKSLNENHNINIPVNSFFASHIGVFGNTGSGKSNTLHKLYYELFNLKEFPYMMNKSNFVVLDFNGEYVHEDSFGINASNKQEKCIYELSTNKISKDKIPIKYETFFEEEMLSVLFSATQQTQKPFISRLLKRTKKYKHVNNSLANWIISLIKRIYTGVPNQDVRDRLVQVLEKYIHGIEKHLNNIKETKVFNSSSPYFYHQNWYGENIWHRFQGDFDEISYNVLELTEIKEYIIDFELDGFQEFEIRSHLQLLNDLLYESVMPDHILPLLRRIETRLGSISKFVDIVEVLPPTPFLQIVSLKNLNSESKKFLSLIISKMYFDSHKNKVEKGSFHLIIDEAHNILSSQSTREQDGWMDYRLELFEEIIKEGRKFGFFLTLASQRPADISETILSQVHNFFLHKLVNERDLNIIDNSISTLDRISKSMLPVLSQGVCVISGTALTMPVTAIIDYIENESLRPQSDTIVLTDVWN